MGIVEEGKLGFDEFDWDGGKGARISCLFGGRREKVLVIAGGRGVNELRVKEGSESQKEEVNELTLPCASLSDTIGPTYLYMYLFDVLSSG